jgi:hypothetical protein
MSASAPSLASVRPDLPLSLIKVIDRCLDYEREQRWQTVDALRRALRALKLVDAPTRSRSVTDSEVAPHSMSTLTNALRIAPRAEKKLLAVLATVAIVAVAYYAGAQFQSRGTAQLLKGLKSTRIGFGAFVHTAPEAHPSRRAAAPERASTHEPGGPVLAATTPPKSDRRAVHAKQRQLVGAATPEPSEKMPAASNDELLSTDPLNRRH